MMNSIHPQRRPRRIAGVLLVGVALVGLLTANGCRLVSLVSGVFEGPTDVYYRMVAAAKMGDRETFLETFTSDSRSVIDALLKLSDIYGAQRNSPYELLVATEVLGEEPGPPEKVAGKAEPAETAILTVQAGRHGKRLVKMLKTDEGWKIDALDLERFWDAKRSNFRF